MDKINNVMAELAKYTMIAKETDGIIEALRDEIKAYMQENGLSELIGNEHSATWKECKRVSIDGATLKKELPEVAAAYSKETVYKAFKFA